VSEFTLIFLGKVWSLLLLQVVKWGLLIRLYKLKERVSDSFNRAGGLKNYLLICLQEVCLLQLYT